LQEVLKYQVRISFKVDGVVERPDIVGAIFGQTEGLFGPELNLNELQKTFKIGRIEITTKSEKGKTTGTVNIPMSTDISTAALIAASLETIDKVGPCASAFKLEAIDDVRNIKKQQIADRAKEIVKNWATTSVSESEEIHKDIQSSQIPEKITSFGKEKLPAGPAVKESDSIFVVEGRADVLVFLKAGIENVVAVEGTKVPLSIIKLSKTKKLIAVLDGDRGGDMIKKELMQVTNIKIVLRAPRGKEVEDLTPIEVKNLLEHKRIPSKPKFKKEFKQREPSFQENDEDFDEPTPPSPKSLEDCPAKLLTSAKKIYDKINGTLEASLLDKNFKSITQTQINALIPIIEKKKNCICVILDGIVTQRLVDTCKTAGIKYLIGHRLTKLNNVDDIDLYTFQDLGI
tara:strand:+ start:78 stop:1280 length:1203 start_codon:yes stop_codon:yes gene_type:complete